jgi:hypothetical protein
MIVATLLGGVMRFVADTAFKTFLILFFYLIISAIRIQLGY